MIFWWRALTHYHAADEGERRSLCGKPRPTGPRWVPTPVQPERSQCCSICLYHLSHPDGIEAEAS